MEDLRGTATPELETTNTPKIMGAVVVALGVGALGAYTLSAGIWNSPSPPRVIASTEPAPVKLVKPVAAVAPATPAPVMAPSSPYQHTALTPAATPVTRVAHVRKSEAPVTHARSTTAPSVPADAMTPASAPVPESTPTSAQPDSATQPAGQP